MGKYPEHEKINLNFNNEEIGAIEEFIEFLINENYTLASEDYNPETGQPFTRHTDFSTAFNDFLGIDERILEAERKQMLEDNKNYNPTTTRRS
jgi:hypothetical protein